MNPNYNHVPFVSVDQMMQLVTAVGIEKFMADLASFIKTDFERWKTFDKTPRVASHTIVSQILIFSQIRMIPAIFMAC